MAKKIQFSEYSDNYLQKWSLEVPILRGFWRGTVEMKVPRYRGLTHSCNNSSRIKSDSVEMKVPRYRGVDTFLINS